jgi:hypothetical protein
MNMVMSLLVLGSSIWMAVDASQLGYDKRDIRGIAAMGPAGWFLCGLFLWIVAFPLYLIKRPELKAAGDARKKGLVGGPPGFLPPHGYPPPQGYPQAHAYPPPQGYPQGPRAQAPTMSTEDVARSIEKLGEMRAKGLLTDAEFEQQKAQVLARMG